MFRQKKPTEQETELAGLRARHEAMSADLREEQGKRAQLEADLLAGVAGVDAVTTARQRCAVLSDAVESLQRQITAREGDVAAAGKAQETERTLEAIGELQRGMAARRGHFEQIRTEARETLETALTRMAAESEAYRAERAELQQLVAQLREMRGTPGANPAADEIELPQLHIFTPAPPNGDVVALAVAQAYRAFAGRRVTQARSQSMAAVPQGYGPGGLGDPLAKAKGIEDLRERAVPAGTR